jgi:hypothetical protein
MKSRIILIGFLAFVLLSLTMNNSLEAQASDSLSSSFSLPENGCVQHHINIVYTGNAPETATYNWDFGDAVVLFGSGQGPYWVKWETVGMKSVSLEVFYTNDSSTTTRQIHIQPQPTVFHMTGGGSYMAGGAGVEVGLSGSQSGIPYKLRRNGAYTGTFVTGNGNAISFGLQTEPGSYTSVADGPACDQEMADTVAVTILYPAVPNICMVTFDTALQKNKIIWHKVEGIHLSHFNIYKETSQDEHYEKVGEVSYSSLSIYVDQNSFPLVKSDKYRITVCDSGTYESEKSPYHKTIHLNINAGIYGYNLIWNHYTGFEFLTYNIYRKLMEGPFEMIGSVASNIDSYTDFYMQPGLATYYVEVVRMEPCTPDKKDQIFNSVVSNTATAAPLGIEDNQKSGVIVYPNPAKDKVFIVTGAGHGNSSRIELFQPNGQLLFIRDITEIRSEVDLTNLDSGVYFLRISTEDSTVVKKIIKK